MLILSKCTILWLALVKNQWNKGGPYRVRTSDHSVMSRALYLTKLRAHQMSVKRTTHNKLSNEDLYKSSIDTV